VQVEPVARAPPTATVDTGSEAPSSSTVAPTSSLVAAGLNEEIANGYRLVEKLCLPVNQLI